MNELDEDAIERSLKKLAAMELSVEETGRAIKAARRAIMRRTLMQWTVRSAIAAAVLIALAFGIINLTQQRATAAEVLAQMVDASNSYKGWVHRRFAHTGQQKGQYTIQHFDNRTGVWVIEKHGHFYFDVTMYVPDEKKEVHYTSEDADVHIGDLEAEFAKRSRKLIEESPLDVAAQAAKLPTGSVKQSRDGDLIRFDITLPKDEAKKAFALDEPPPQQIVGMIHIVEFHIGDTTQPAAPPLQTSVIWADAQTKLIRKGYVQDGNRRLEFAYTYGLPEIHDIYDANVPREARVVDVRPPKDVNQLLDKLKQRHDQGFGDYLAITTTAEIGPDGKPTAHGAMLDLDARSGESMRASRYIFDEPLDQHRQPTTRHVPLPQGWPTPTMDAALSSVRNELPLVATISDGQQTWMSMMNGNSPFTSIQDKAVQAQIKMDAGLPGHLWPTRQTLGLFGSGSKAELIHDPKRPALVGLRVQHDSTGPGGSFQLQDVHTMWIDPAKDDLAVGQVWSIEQIAPDGSKPMVSQHYQTCNGFARTNDGKWYPSLWRDDTTSEYNDKKIERSAESHLQLWPGKKLDPQWFSDPTKQTK